ncbi:hypothetical protein J437_LFUL017749 [Ladona fulva]|uniref:Amine oxidase domain-containing protein n=1 Tax=Ladona fulva TaxID=123851 RepID=A0A8K0KT79_LADFU|nr:hypothetical protein J437_LFUL017749 [Ladona fulva]
MFAVRLFRKLPEGYIKTVQEFMRIRRCCNKACAQPPNNPCSQPPFNPCTPNNLETAPKDPRVVIIGAGIAGLSAANQLTENGICKVKVLEASDRAGGRIHSCWLGDTVVELGAEWIEGGCPSNSAFTLAAQEGLIGRPFLSREDLSHFNLFYSSSGKPIEPWLGKTAAEAYRKIENEVLSLSKRMGAYSEVDKTGLNLRQFINGIAYVTEISIPKKTLLLQ